MTNPRSPWRSPLLEQVWTGAIAEAQSLAHPHVGIEHLAISLSRCEGGFTERLLKRLDTPPNVLRKQLRILAGGPRAGRMSQEDPLTPRLRRALDSAIAGTGEPLGERECLLMLITCDGGVLETLCELRGWDRQELTSWVMDDHDAEATRYVDPEVAVAQGGVIFLLDQFGIGGRPQARGERRDPPEPARAKTRSALDEFGRDLTEAARENRLREAYGRGELLTKMARVLAQDECNNPVLVGEAGVGKTALVEGLAWRLVQTDRPISEVYRLEGCRIIEISVGRLTAGTEYRGAFEQRLQRIIDEASADPKVILFFDELHTLVGAGRASGSLDAAQILKPALARGNFRCIGATTSAEFDRFIAGDSALARRFERIEVPEPSEEAMVAILRDWRPGYQDRYGVTVTDGALNAAVRLSTRYMPNRRLPEKAIKALDSARVLAGAGGVLMSLRAVDGAHMDAHGIPAMSSTTVTEEHVARALTEMTGVQIQQDVERGVRLSGLESELTKRVVGQEAVIQQVSAAIQPAFAGLHDPDRPRAVMLFCGPTGVGKTQLAKALAEKVCGKDQFRMFDMAEFSEPHTVARLIGAPPGYVGHDHGGELTDWLREHPQSVVLFDEIEKADPQLMDFFLGLFGEGRATDGRGREVSGRNAIFIMTSNIVLRTSNLSMPGFNLGSRPMPRPSDREIRALLREHLRAELIGRIDEVVVFNPLSDEALDEIVGMELGKIEQRVAENWGARLDVDKVVRALIVQHSSAQQSGAREIAATVRRLINGPLGAALLDAGDLKDKTLHIRLRDGAIVVQPGD